MKTKQILLIAIICLFPRFLFSQKDNRIIYTEFESDYLIYNTSCVGDVWMSLCDTIDINYDGIWDIRFWYSSDSSVGVEQAYEINYVDNMRACFICNQDDNDNLSEYIYDIKSGWWYYHYSYCDTIAEHENKMGMGFRKSVGDGWCYGWLRYTMFRLPNYGGFSYELIDMAYCTIPDYPLKYGQKDFVNIEENEYATTNAELFPNPVEDRLSLQLSGNASCKNVEIYGIDGRLLKSQNEDFENIDVSNLSSGLYIAKIKLSDGNVFTEKVVVK